MSEPSEDEKRFYQLKPRNFERVNAPKGEEDADPNDVRALLSQNLTRDNEARTRSPFPTKPNPRPNVDDPNDVYTVLNENLVKHKASTQPLDLTKPPSRRRRDYFGALILGNLAFLGVGILLPINIVVALFILGGITMYSAGLTWVFWAVMSDY